MKKEKKQQDGNSSSSLVNSHNHDTMHSKERIKAVLEERRQFEEYYIWLEKSMPSLFFKNITKKQIMLIAHNLMGFNLKNYFAEITLPDVAIVMCCDDSDADLTILRDYRHYGIKSYRTFSSRIPLDIVQNKKHLRVGIITFTKAHTKSTMLISPEHTKELKTLVKKRNSSIDDNDVEEIISHMDPQFLHSLPITNLAVAFDLFSRAKTSDHCQYEILYNKNWEEKEQPSLHIMLAWKNTPKYNFLYRIAHIVNRHNLVIQHTTAAYSSSDGNHTILTMQITLHGEDNRAAWDITDINDLMREIATAKYFPDQDTIDNVFVSSRRVTGTAGNILRIMNAFIHQALVLINPNLYTFEHVEEALCRHEELTIMLLDCFSLKFDPDKVNMKAFKKKRAELTDLIEKLDSGHATNDICRKNVLKQGLNFIEHTLRTNFFCDNKTALSFRLDPHYLDYIPFDRTTIFPDLPYGIYFTMGMHYVAFHIRFKDLARGGLRTVMPHDREQMIVERDTLFTECYNLAYTQQKKNKDIPEGGAKGVIFLKPFEQLDFETTILEQEMRSAKKSQTTIKHTLEMFRNEQQQEYLYHAQRSFIEALLTIVNSDEKGSLRAEKIIDYLKKPEYIYLGPDEHMHNSMIEWIATRSIACGYKPGGAFITSKPSNGINHKEYGVTSLGVSAYMDEVLHYIGLNPVKEMFTVKISGGPDGDVAGNMIRNLHRLYPKTAKLVALIDVSGTIQDLQGLDLDELTLLFKESKPLRFYPPEKLSDGGFLLDLETTRELSPFVKQTRCVKKINGSIVEEWLSGSEMNSLYRQTVHKTPVDIFIPSGGRPQTLNSSNYREFLNAEGKPTARAIVEGANLYLTPEARRELEKLGTIIIKDSSANKGGVICSSFEVLCGLALGEELFAENKETLVIEILDIIEKVCRSEAQLMLTRHKTTGEFLTDISEDISKKINAYTYQILDYLDKIELGNDASDPLITCFLHYCPKTVQEKYAQQLIDNIPDSHKKAIIACRISSRIIYEWGLDWAPSIVDVLPILWNNSAIA